MGGKWLIVGKSGEKCLKVVKSGKKWRIDGKSVKKWLRVAKSGEYWGKV